MPLKEGVVELREKGAPLRFIRELLLNVNVAVKRRHDRALPGPSVRCANVTTRTAAAQRSSRG